MRHNHITLKDRGFGQNDLICLWFVWECGAWEVMKECGGVSLCIQT